MANEIKINKNLSVQLHFETQISPNGRPFRQSGLILNGQIPSKWFEKTLKYHWIYSFKYLDEDGGFLEIEIDYNDNFVRLIK